ncbi:hypothetical protein [Kitasatospora viridis]|uniref:WD40 repeat protein n=1 Tax=Kitasatospora viridis TaxID=281105 RepID=A0A561S9C5_9ACTN|nr:hypothetical protein [Kitasatospora viridis]TWF71473.1 hypothetical protein FHX73_19103 [Kitasatospora viridis]
MSITAQLRDSVELPGGDALVNGFAFEARRAGARRALLRRGDGLAVYQLADLFAQNAAPAVVFPLPWPGWAWGVHSVSPDGRFAVFAGQRAVRAVDADGRTLWEYRHACWGPALGHPHSGDDQEVCRGSEHGSCRVSDDGRLVWAHVLGEEEELWVVLDARDGTELARLPLESAASGSHQLSHPDGVHVGLCVGMGQDGIMTYWARWDGEQLTSWDLNATEDRILGDVHPAHPGFLTVEHYGADLRLHALDGTTLATATPEEAWDYACGFVDADTVIASTTEADQDHDEPRHWLLDARTLRILGPVRYPDGPVDGYVRPLGDGSWLTYDDRDGTLRRWSRAGATAQPRPHPVARL